jgi:hypothetical protein
LVRGTFVGLYLQASRRSQAVPGDPSASGAIPSEIGFARNYGPGCICFFSGSSGFLVHAWGTCVYWLCPWCLNGLQSAIAQDGYRGSKMVLRLSQDGLRWRKTIPRWAQNESMKNKNDLRCSQDGPKVMRESRHMACTQPKADQDASIALHRQWTLARSVAKS